VRIGHHGRQVVVIAALDELVLGLQHDTLRFCLRQAAAQVIGEAVKPLCNPELRELLLEIKKKLASNAVSGLSDSRILRASFPRLIIIVSSRNFQEKSMSVDIKRVEYDIYYCITGFELAVEFIIN